MRRIARQMILGFGTFGTGTALLFLDVNPYLLVLTDAVVGVGMLFAAGSVTMDDLHHLRGKGEPGEIPPPGTARPPKVAPAAPGKAEATGGFGASLRRFGRSLKPAFSPLGMKKEDRETREKEIDEMLDTALVGQSKRLISIAEGRAGTPVPAGATGGAAPLAKDLAEELQGGEPAAPFLDEEVTGEEEGEPGEVLAAGVEPPAEDVRPPALLYPGGGEGGAPGEVLPLGGGGPDADDLLSALRLEAMKEKKRDDTSLLRDLKGVKVTGKQLLDELDSLVREMRGK